MGHQVEETLFILGQKVLTYEEMGQWAFTYLMGEYFFNKVYRTYNNMGVLKKPLFLQNISREYKPLNLAILPRGEKLWANSQKVRG